MSVSPNAANWLLVSWLVGVALLSVRLSFGIRSARRLTRTLVTEPSLEILSHAERLVGLLNITAAVKVLESAIVQVPTAMGWLKPVVLLPAQAMTGLSIAQIDALVAHELAHIKRHDYLVNLLQSAIETLLFYHPAVWLISRRVRHERELCCDDLAIAVCGDDRLTYASALADLESLRQEPGPALAANGGSLLTRVRRILAPDDVQTVRGRGHWMAGVAILSAALVMIAAQNVQGRQRVSSVQSGVAGGVVGGVATGVTGGVSAGTVGAVVGGAANGVAGGVAGGIVGGVADGVAGGVADGVAGAEMQKIAVGQIVRLEVTVTPPAMRISQRQTDMLVGAAFTDWNRAKGEADKAQAETDRLAKVDVRDPAAVIEAAKTVPGLSTDSVVVGYLNSIEGMKKTKTRMIAESGYGAQHPRIIAIDTDIASTTSQLKSRLQGLVDTARLNADVSKKSEDRFRSAYDALNAKPHSVTGAPVRDAEFSKDYTVQEDGTILLPYAGKTKAAGLTLMALQDSVRLALRAQGQRVVKVLASIEARAADKAMPVAASPAAEPHPPVVPDPPTAAPSTPARPQIPAPQNVPGPKQVPGYAIGLNDVLKVAVYSGGISQQDFSTQNYTVQADGSIVLPLAGPVRVAGLSLTAASTATKQALLDAHLFNECVVDMAVMQYRSSLVRVQGAVRNPGNIEMTADRMNVSDALSKAAGLQPQAGTQIRVKRAGGRPTAADIRVENGWEMYSRQDLDSGKLADVQLYDGDTIDIPVAAAQSKLSPAIIVQGCIKHPGEYPWEEGLTLQGAITKAGGFTVDAAQNRVSVTRVDPQTGREVELKNLKMDFVTQAGDKIAVPVRHF